MKKFVKLFLIMLKIGLFTFGGGYAMIALLESEFVTKRKWISGEEFADMIAVAESTPGPVAINSATYIGYRIGGVLGSVLSTVAVCIPSFTIIYLISLFFNSFMEIGWIAAAFRGVRICVVFLIFSAGVKLYSKLKKTAFNLVVFIAAFAVSLLLPLFAVDFSSIFYILVGGAAGLAVYLILKIKKRK